MPKGVYLRTEEHKSIMRRRPHRKIPLDVKSRISEACKKNGVGKWMLGRKFSESTCLKMGQSRVGFKHSEKSKNKIKLSHTGMKHSKETTNKMKLQIGDKGNNWKGGRTYTGEGYVHIKSWDHPYHNLQGYVLEHRLVMEKHIGRYLTHDEVVHHIDENPSNNKIENLILFSSNSTHRAFHKKEQAVA